MSERLLKHKKRKVEPKRELPAEQKKTVLVGTYKGDQLKRWPGFYNYPIYQNDKFDEQVVSAINEIWLFKGAKAGKFYASEFVGIKTRKELISDFGYKPSGKGHGTGRYLLFKLTHELYNPVADFAESVVVRASDFARTPSVRSKLKAYLESPEREDPILAKCVPPLLASVPYTILRVCEEAVQLDFWPIFGSCVDQRVPFPAPEHPRFTFIDLFAGIGGFHLAMHQLGGKCVFACEWDKCAQATYAKNYGIAPEGDITKIDEKRIPKHDVLCAGFPCQAFSKAGKQLGFADETKGTLFFDIERILRHHKSKYIILENVRNLVAHDHGNTWKTIYSHLVKLGYRLTPEPLIVSPHYFGIPQLRERVVILGVYDPDNASLPLEISLPQPKSKSDCSLDSVLEANNHDPRYALTQGEIEIIDTWDEFYHGIKEAVIGFPIWLDWFKSPPDPDMPEWKQEFIRKNNQLYKNNKKFIDGWLKRHNNLCTFTPTMRKMEWQCGKSVASAWDAFLQMRPSGLRIKRPDCAPALVAIVQVPIIGKYRRRMTLKEAARLQSFDDSFIPDENMHEAYKQFGNAVNVDVIKECAKLLFRETGEKDFISD